MSSVTTSSSIPPSQGPALMHTLNSRGNLGMFVDPSRCSCVTCESVKTKESEAVGAGASESAAKTELQESIAEFEEAWYAAGGGTLRSPSLGGTSTTWYLGSMLEDIQDRCKALGLPEYEPPTYRPGSGAMNGPATVSEEAAPSFPFLQAIGQSYIDERTEQASSSVTENTYMTDVNTAFDTLRDLRVELIISVDELWANPKNKRIDFVTLHRQEEAIKDKIDAIEHLFNVFGVSHSKQ